VRVEIVSDVVCPWCYIGKRRFEAALARFPGRDRVEVVWRPYQLDPRAPRQPSPALDVYARKFGGPAEAVRIVEHLTQVAADVGLEFRMDRALRANTFDAHRLLAWAEPRGRQGELAERLFQAYFCEGLDVGDPGTLARLAGDVGLDEAAATAMLQSADGVAELHEALAGAADRGISAVPTFVFQGRFGVPGAQEPDTLLAMLERVAERFPDDPLNVDAAEACGEEACARPLFP
jgi:predicted DsbA family dithiol-disulfide isomerase